MRKKRILIVDDDITCLNFMNILLEETFIVKRAKCGEESLAIIGKFYPDLVVLDVMMPGMDGFEVSKVIRDREPKGKTKIMFVSAKEPSIEKKIEISNHGYGFLLKPFEDKSFNSLIERLLAA